MYIDLRPDEPAPDPESKPRHDDGDATIEADDSLQAPMPARRGPRDPADEDREDRPALRTLRIFRVLMDD